MTADDERRLGILAPGQRPTTHTDIADFSCCPDCVAEDDGAGHATRYFNGGGDLWAVCERHGVRWYVTRALVSPGIPDVPDQPGSLFDLRRVDGVFAGA